MHLLSVLLPILVFLTTVITAHTSHDHHNFHKRNLATIRSIYNLTIFPNQVPVLLHGASAVPPGLFSSSATGRVSPVGTFAGFADSVEYFFALAPVPAASPHNGSFSKAEVVEFTSGCREVASSVVYLTTAVFDPGAPDHGKLLAVLKQVAFWRFDDRGAVLAYDAWIPNLSAWVEASSGIPISNAQAQAGTVAALCDVIQQRCTAANQQYPDAPTCVATLMARPFGNYDEAWGDNVVCRGVHAVLTQVRPQVHCPHVGPTGGGKCVDIPYNTQYFNDSTLFGQELGKTFTCAGGK